MNKLSIVIPVYWNEESIPILYQKLIKVENQLKTIDFELELIFVDDGSGDHSLNKLLEIKQARPDTRVIKLSRNFGAVSASKTGIRFVSGDCFLILAADLQDPPELIFSLVQRWVAGSKYVICARGERQDPVLNKFFAGIYYVLLRLFVIKNYPFNGYDMALMDKMFLPYIQKIGQNINTPLFCYWLGIKPDIIHYERQKRVGGKSKWTFRKRVNFFVNSILGFSVLPLRTISVFGFIVSLISFVYGALVIVARLKGEIPIQGYAALASLISFLLGIVIMELGIIGEYIWRIFEQVINKPEAVVEEVY